MGRGWWVRRVDEVPMISPEEPADPDWYPLQHHFGFTGFGANAYVARAAAQVLVDEHDETDAGHEELYFVAAGRAQFTLDGEDHELAAGSVVAVLDPSVRRRAIALEPGTTLLAIGARPDPAFESSWQAHHFEGIPLAH